MKEIVKFVGTCLFVESARVMPGEHLSEVVNKIHEFVSLAILEWR